jgi:hypothetical protein
LEHDIEQQTFGRGVMVKSISYNQHEIIKWIIALHCTTNIQLDPTYCRGNFYKDGIIEPLWKFDITPVSTGVQQADCRYLPLDDNCIDTMIFDPPFLATRGKSLNMNTDGNKIVKRYGLQYCTEHDLHEFYVDSMIEFSRILKPNGVLIFKCQDKVSSGIQYLSHCFIIQLAVELGYYPQDIFILLAKNRITANWQCANQKHARKFHSYFIVLRNGGRKVKYISE